MGESEKSPDVVWHEDTVHRDDRWAAVGVHGVTVWLTGLSGSGKSTIASSVVAALTELGTLVYSLDGDNLRHGLNGDLGFSPEDRTENVRRVAEVARLFADAGAIAIVPVISPYREGREHARRIHEVAGLTFLEVFVDAPLEVCETRDPKGLYAKARAGELRGFTGVDDPYEPPEHAELVIDTSTTTPEVAAIAIVELLRGRGVLSA